LQCFTRDVERKVLRVDNTLDEVEIFRNEIVTVIHDENAPDIELDVVALLFRFEKIERRTVNLISVSFVRLLPVYAPFRHEEDSLEFELTFYGEVLDCEVIFPVICQTLVE
jgi:hypothetical protein